MIRQRGRCRNPQDSPPQKRVQLETLLEALPRFAPAWERRLSISSDVLVEELKMENNLLKRKIQVLQELLEFKMEKIRAENGNIKK